MAKSGASEIAVAPAASRLKLGLTVFLSGAAVMVYELLGSRVIAPYVGSSLYVWTSLIGVILAALAIGYALGGWVADRSPKAEHLSSIFSLAALGVLAAILGKDLVMSIMLKWHLPSAVKSLIVTFTLFTLPSICLGMVSPFVTRLALRDLQGSGRTVGLLGALSTFGSIVGTFATGYFIISWAGTTVSLYGLAVVLLLLALFWAKGIAGRVVVVLLIALTVGLGFASVAQLKHAEKTMARYDIDTAYQRVLVVEGNQPNGERMRLFVTDVNAIYSAADPENPSNLVVGYVQNFDYWRAKYSPQNVLVAGGAGYVYPTYLLRTQPEMKVTTVELDPQMWAIAKEHFGAQESGRLTRVDQDVRIYSKQAQAGAFDMVFYDIFNGAVLPFHTATVEAYADLKRLMTPQGVIVINAVDGVEAPRGELAQALVATLRKAFANVALYYNNMALDKSLPTNLCVVASDGPLPDLPNRVQVADGSYDLLYSHQSEIAANPLTDDYAPTEALLRPL